MKNLILLALFVSGIFNAQIFTKSELKFNDEGFAHFTKNIQIKNGKNEMAPVDLSVSVVKDFADTINFDKLEDMLNVAISESKYALKNKSTFNPIAVRIKALNADGLLIWLDYTGQNDYGAPKDASKLIYFDKEGNVTKSL